MTRTARQAGEDTASEGLDASGGMGQGNGDRRGFIRRIGRVAGGAASWGASGARSVVRAFKRRVAVPAWAEALSGDAQGEVVGVRVG